jgi:hypothetical protein
MGQINHGFIILFIFRHNNNDYLAWDHYNHNFFLILNYNSSCSETE